MMKFYGAEAERAAESNPVSRGRLIAGWVLSAIPASMLILGAVNAYSGSAQVVAGTGHLGYPVHLLPVIGTLELLCALLFLLPQTAVLGAILLTGYFGGAVASHVRIGETLWVAAATIGVFVWLGIWLREPRLSDVLPLRR